MNAGETDYQTLRMKSDKRFLSLSLFVLFFLIVGGANAQQKSTTSVSEIAPKEPFKRLSMELLGEISTNLYSDTSSSKESSMALTMIPTIHFKNQTKLVVTGILSRDISEEHKTKFSNTRLDYSLRSIENKALKLTVTPGIVLPTDYDLYETDSLRGAASLGLPTVLKIPVENLKVIYAPRFTKNFHEFNTNANYRSNLEYSLRHRLQLGYEVTSKLSIGLVSDFTQGWTYRGTAKQSFAMAQEISYALSKQLSAAVSHSNEGSAKKQGGAGSNIEMFNDHTSQLTLGLDYVF